MFAFALIQEGVHCGRRVHLGSCGFSQGCLGVVGFTRFRLGSLMRNLGSSRSFGISWFNCALLIVAWFIHGSLVRSLSSPGSLGFCRFAKVRLGVVGFVRVHVGSVERGVGALVNSGGPWGGRVNLGLRGFSRVCLGVVGFIRVRVFVHSGAPRDSGVPSGSHSCASSSHRVYSGSRGFTGASSSSGFTQELI